MILVIGTCVGAVMIAGFERYRGDLEDWVLADPAATSQRLKWLLRSVTGLLIAPLLAFAAYLWSLGGKAIEAREFPPPGLRVIRDTPIQIGEKAVSRGRLLQALALACVIASAVFGFLIWRLESMAR